MKKAIKTLVALVLALVLAASLSAAAWADGDENGKGNGGTTTPQATVTVNGLADSETVNAYKLISYVEPYYNTLTIFGSYKSYLETKSGETDTNKILTWLIDKPAAGVLEGYLASENNDLPVNPQTKTATNNKVEFTFEPGYYLLTVTTTTAANRLYLPMGVFVQPAGNELRIYAGEGTTPTISDRTEIFAKSVNTSIEKKVKDGSTWSTTATAGVGDTADFYVKIDIPHYPSGSKISMELTDTLTNMSYVVGSAKLYSKINNDETFDDGDVINATGALSVDTTADKPPKFTLGYDAIMVNASADKTVYLYYKARVEQTAANGGVAENKAELTYANANIPTDKRTTDSQIVKVYNYAFNLTKYGENTFKSLSGAEFKIYPDNNGTADTTEMKFSEVKDDADNILYYVPSATGTVTKIPAAFTVKGLAPGVYHVEETTTPKGYFAPAGNFTLTLTAAKEDGSQQYNGMLNSTSTFTNNDDKDKNLIPENGVSVKNNTLTVQLKNALTPVLPSTGGAGTAVFTVAGVAVMVLAAVLFLRRKKEEE